MNVRDLVPWTRRDDRDHALPPQHETASPLFALQREMNRLFDDAFRGFGMPALWGGRSGWPQLEIEETDKEYRITAELPGLEDKDVELLLQDDVLILRGEKRAETDDRARGFSERVYGRFERRIGLEGADEAHASASFKNGILKITVPKSADNRDRTKRIPINSAGAVH